MKRYLVYELKKSAFVILCITVILAAVYFIALATGFMEFPSSYQTYLWLISLGAGLIAAAMPVGIFEYKMKRRGADLYYSLPLSHRHILTVKYLLGLISIFGPYTVVYWSGAFIGMGMAFAKINAVIYIAQYFASLIPIYIIYSVSAFIYTRANTQGDGYMFVVFWALALLLVTTLLSSWTTNYWSYYGGDVYNEYVYDYSGYMAYKKYIYPGYYAPYAPLNYVTTKMQMLLAKDCNEAVTLTTAETANIWIGFAINILMSIGATVGLFVLEGKVKAENVSQISDSYFGYKVMIPLFTYCLAALCMGEIVLLILLAIASYMVTVAYKRTLKIGWKSLICIAAPMILGIVTYAIFWAVYN